MLYIPLWSLPGRSTHHHPICLQANDYNKLKEKTATLVSTNQRLTTEAEKQQQTVAQQTEYIQSFESVDKKSTDNVLQHRSLVLSSSPRSSVLTYWPLSPCTHAPCCTS